MDFPTFITKIVDALAWPGVVLALLWWLRPHFGTLVRRLEEVSIAGAKARFLKEAIEGAHPVSPRLAPPVIGEMDVTETPDTVAISSTASTSPSPSRLP